MDHEWPIFERRVRTRGRNKRGEMCTLPLLGQLTAFGRLLAWFDTWFRKLHQYPISEILDKMVEMLGNSFKPNDRDACDLIFKKLYNQRRERNLELDKGEFYGPITKKWLFYLLELRYAQSKGSILANVRMEISEIDRIARKSLERA